MIENHIVNLICERIAEECTQAMRSWVSDDDPLKVDNVKVGRYQSAPGDNPIRISVMGGDLDDDKLKDRIVPYTEGRQGFGVQYPQREIGGTMLWERNGTIRLECFFIPEGYSEETARQYAYAVMGRLFQLMRTGIHVYDLRDDFGEHAIQLFVAGTTAIVSGGPPSSYYWRMKIYWICITEMED